MRVLVTGASGLLGGRLASLLTTSFDVVAAAHHRGCPAGLTTVPFELEHPATFASALAGARAEAVVHCAALADGDACQADLTRARRLNVDAPRILARCCHASGLRLVSLSTDMVFDGTRAFSTEDVRPRPVLAYGETKLQGEDAVLTECPEAAVVRVALVHGRGYGQRGTASETIAWRLRQGLTLRLFTDQYRTPIDPDSVADAVARLLHGSQQGRFHLGGAERLSRYELGLRTARAFELPADGLIPVRQSDQPIGIARPADVSLATERALRELGWRPRPVDVGISESRRQSD
jgi:dTDP-4-dehydrorhamnose reductase